MSTNARAFYAELGIDLPSSGQNAEVACFTNPDAHRHEDRNKSCSVHLGTGAFNCHGCGAQGGAFDAAVARGRSRKDAMELLKRHGLARDDDGAQRPRIAHSSTNSTAPSAETIERYHKILLADEGQMKRLSKLRGWTREAIERLGVGVDLTWKHPRGGGPIVFPARDADGKLTGLVHYQPNPEKRVNGDGETISKSLAHGPRQLFPRPEWIEGGTAWLVEGEPDAVAAHSLGLPAVGVPGVKGWKDDWARRFERFRTVVVCTHADDPGRELADRLEGALSAVTEVRRLELGELAGERDGDGYDLTDALLEASRDGGVGQLQRLLADAVAALPALKPSAGETGTTTVDTAEQAGSDTDHADWPAPATHLLPTFPTDALPRSVAAWVGAVAEESQTPEDLAALAALGVLSAAAMGSAVIDCGAWEEELPLYLLVAMPSGDRKSTVLRSAVAPLRVLERERRDAAAPKVRELRSRRQVLEKTEQKLIKAVTDADAEIRSELEGELTRATAELAEIGEPVLPRLLADDATPEALGGLLAHHGSIAVIAAESALLDNIGGRYSEGAANLHLVCSAYGGESTTIDRRGRDPEEIERPLMTIALAVQPHVLERLIGHSIARSQGLVARFAYALPETQLGRRKINAGRMTPEAREGWERIVRHVFENPKTHDTNDNTPPNADNTPSSVISVMAFQGTRITLTDGAQALLDGLRAEHEPRLAEMGDLRPVADWAARHPGRIARIGGLLHLAEHDAREPISEATMGAALRIGDYLLSHGLAALTGPDPLACRAMGWLARRGERQVTQRDLQRGPAQSGTAEDADALTSTLERLGALRPLPSKPAGPGRPSSAAYEVHPNLIGGTRPGHDRNDRNRAAPGDLGQ